MAWTIEFAPEAERVLEKLDRKVAQRIVRFMNDRIAPLDDPRRIGTALQGRDHAGLWRYRVGDYRVIARFFHDRIIVQVVRIGHRSDVYR